MHPVAEFVTRDAIPNRRPMHIGLLFFVLSLRAMQKVRSHSDRENENGIRREKKTSPS
jgi:hypothetical protein